MYNIYNVLSTWYIVTKDNNSRRSSKYDWRYNYKIKLISHSVVNVYIWVYLGLRLFTYILVWYLHVRFIYIIKTHWNVGKLYHLICERRIRYVLHIRVYDLFYTVCKYKYYVLVINWESFEYALSRNLCMILFYLMSSLKPLLQYNCLVFYGIK